MTKLASAAAAGAAFLVLCAGLAQAAPKYMISWEERPQGSPLEYENAQKRILGLFKHWRFPESITVHQFVVTVGDFGGYMVVETDDLAAIQQLTSSFPAFRYRVEAVLDVQDAVAAEVAAIGWRDAVPAD